jgi:hypothetical protein
MFVYPFVVLKKRDPVPQMPPPEERVRYRVEHPATEEERSMAMEMVLTDELRRRMDHMGFHWVATHIGWAYPNMPFFWTKLEDKSHDA